MFGSPRNYTGSTGSILQVTSSYHYGLSAITPASHSHNLSMSSENPASLGAH